MPYVDPTLIPSDPKDPITSESYTALRDNPTAIAGGEEDAPITRGGWVPYDMVEYGDGADGVIYDFSVDGAVASITSPTFVKGWDYKLVFFSLANSTGYTDLRIQGYRVNDSTWANIKSFLSSDWNPSVTTDTQVALDGEFNYHNPMSGLMRVMKYDYSTYFASSGLDAGNFSGKALTAPVLGTSGVTFNQARLALVSSGSFTGGKVLLYKRGFGEL